MTCFIDGWMTESKKAAHLNMMSALKDHTITVLKFDPLAVSKEARIVKDRKREYERVRKIRQNTWIDPKPKPEPRQRGFGE